MANYTRPSALAQGVHPISNVFEFNLLVVPVNMGQMDWVADEARDKLKQDWDMGHWQVTIA